MRLDGRQAAGARGGPTAPGAGGDGDLRSGPAGRGTLRPRSGTGAVPRLARRCGRRSPGRALHRRQGPSCAGDPGGRGTLGPDGGLDGGDRRHHTLVASARIRRRPGLVAHHQYDPQAVHRRGEPGIRSGPSRRWSSTRLACRAGGRPVVRPEDPPGPDPASGAAGSFHRRDHGRRDACALRRQHAALAVRVHPHHVRRCRDR